MPARSIWNGEIAFDAARIPVKMYAAVEDRDIHFHLLHDQDLVRLQQRMANPRTSRTVEFADAQKGFEVEPGVFVLLDDELAEIAPKPSRDIELTRFVDAKLVHHQRYLRPYYLGPHGSDDDYFALAAAMAEEGTVGVAHWVMRKKEYVGMLHAQDGYLMLMALRDVDQVISPDQLEPPEGRTLDAKERRLAEQLISALEDEFDPTRYHDEYRERVEQLIKAKRRGEIVEVGEYEERPETGTLAEMLRQSVKLSRTKRPSAARPD
jgi:DNA end-binding protein Ku